MRRFDVIDRGMSLLFCGLLIVPTVKATQSNEFDAQAMQVRELLLLEQQQLRREISPTLNADELPIRGKQWVTWKKSLSSLLFMGWVNDSWRSFVVMG